MKQAKQFDGGQAPTHTHKIIFITLSHNAKLLPTSSANILYEVLILVRNESKNFDILLTVHFNIFILTL